MIREKILLDPGWKFHRGDVSDTEEHGYMYSYMHTKAERGRGPASMDFRDKDWETVRLPHDYVVEGVPTKKENPVHGSLDRPNAWYRKSFRLEEADKDRTIHIELEGVCTKSSIWVNGCYMHHEDSAYTEIDLDMTDIARFGDDLNVISVYVDNSDYEGWWYEGGGIYRHVWLIKTDRTAVDHCGVWVHPENRGGECWDVPVETCIRNDRFEDAGIRVLSKIIGSRDEELGRCETAADIASRSIGVVGQVIKVEGAKRWSLEQPNLYRLVTELVKDCKIIDTVETTFGFRTICFDPDEGFFLNGVPTKIKGMCMHEDHGALGVALPDGIKEYRVRRLKEMGCNGYRFSHNPHSRETLDACDRLGMLVMDENRWFESSKNGLRRLEKVIRRDRNHPSVVIWSMGNEESLQDGERGKRIMAGLKACVNKLDTTRPVLMAMHTGLLEDGAAVSADMIGMNYNIELCEQVHKKHPNKAIIFSEANNASEEDVLGNRAAGIRTWELVAERPYLCGLFGWTGMDYRGEHDYPGLFAPCGCMDKNGYAKNSYHLYQTYWRDESKLFIQPHWNGCEPGELVPVRAFSTGEEVTLYLNGKEIGTKKVDPYFQTDWEVAYEPGVLKAVAKWDGIPQMQAERVTTGKPARLLLRLENEKVFYGAHDTAILTVEAEDAAGRIVPDADMEFVVTSCNGAALLAIGNGDVKHTGSLGGASCRLYDGKAQILAEPLEERVSVQVEAAGMEPAQLDFSCKRADPVPEAEYQESRYITEWEMADWTPEKPEVTNISDEALSFYKRVEVGHGTQLHDLNKDSGFLAYHAKARVPKDRDGEPLSLWFELLEGKADILVKVKDEEGKTTGRIMAKKEYEEPGPLRIPIERQEAAETAEIEVCLEVFMPFCGITKPVRWQYGEE